MEEMKLWSKKHQQALKKLLAYYKKDWVKESDDGCLLYQSLERDDYPANCERCYWFLYEHNIKNSYVLTLKDGDAPCEQWTEQWSKKVANKYHKITANIGWLRKCKYYDSGDELFQDFQRQRIEMLEEAIRFWEDRKKLEVHKVS